MNESMVAMPAGTIIKATRDTTPLIMVRLRIAVGKHAEFAILTRRGEPLGHTARALIACLKF